MLTSEAIIIVRLLLTVGVGYYLVSIVTSGLAFLILRLSRYREEYD